MKEYTCVECRYCGMETEVEIKHESTYQCGCDDQDPHLDDLADHEM